MDHVAHAIACEAIYQSWRNTYQRKALIRAINRAWFAKRMLDGYVAAYRDVERLQLV